MKYDKTKMEIKKHINIINKTKFTIFSLLNG